LADTIDKIRSDGLITKHRLFSGARTEEKQQVESQSDTNNEGEGINDQSGHMISSTQKSFENSETRKTVRLTQLLLFFYLF
jgi:hypothetical protein